MEPSQKATCARPSLAAMPTQVEPTTHSTCAMTRSARPSSLRRLACSAVGVSGMVVGKAYRRFALQRRESDTEIGAPLSLPRGTGQAVFSHPALLKTSRPSMYRLLRGSVPALSPQNRKTATSEELPFRNGTDLGLCSF